VEETAQGKAGEPGLRTQKKGTDGKKHWVLVEPGGRQWKWRRFEGAKRN
jgi:hypothetical protein